MPSLKCQLPVFALPPLCYLLPMKGRSTLFSWRVIAVLCATIGLAPFNPPHVVEKLSLLAAGKLVRPVDWFDLLFHGTPWLLLAAKAITALAGGGTKTARR